MKKKKPLTRADVLKLEVTNELGLMDKVHKAGWSGLTTAESGRIGGIVSGKLRKEKHGK